MILKTQHLLLKQPRINLRKTLIQNLIQMTLQKPKMIPQLMSIMIRKRKMRIFLIKQTKRSRAIRMMIKSLMTMTQLRVMMMVKTLISSWILIILTIIFPRSTTLIPKKKSMMIEHLLLDCFEC